VKPLSVHVHGFESEQIYQQLKSINESRLQPFISTLVKRKTKAKKFGNLLRPPSPEQPIIEENIANEEHDDEELLPPKKTAKKKKSVT
jgi:hypothetical protein